MPINNPAPGGGGGPATQLDANGTILDVNAIADGEVLKRVGLTVVGVPVGAPGAHAATHQNGGVDEVNVAGLSGELADPQPPKAHSHLLADLPAELIKPLGWLRAPAAPNALDDEFTDATLDLVQWEKSNHGTSIIDTEPLVKRLIMETPVGAAAALRMVRQAAPAGAFSIQTCFQSYTNGIAASSRICGLFVRSSGASGGVAGRIMTFGLDTFAGPVMITERWTDPATFNATITSIALTAASLSNYCPPFWIRMTWNGASWVFYLNQDGDPAGWEQFGTETNVFLGSAFSHIGLFVWCNTAAIKHRVAFQHFRVT